MIAPKPLWRHPLVADRLRGRLRENRDTGVGRRILEHLLVGEVDRVAIVATLAKKVAERFTVPGLPPLGRHDEAKTTARPQEPETLLDEDHVDVVVSLGRRRIDFLIDIHFDGSPLGQSLDADVRRISDHRVESPMPALGLRSDNLSEAGRFGLPVESVDSLLILLRPWESGIEILGADERVAVLDVGPQRGKILLS